jgi:glycosyltransferase involved in cell wall biosynthesis
MVAEVRRRIRVAFLAPTPPPVMGPSIATTVVFAEAPPSDIELIHLDTADRRGLETLGRIDFANVLQALGMYFGLLKILLLRRPHVVYIPISQTPIGYLRDSVLIVLARILRRRVVLHLRGGNFAPFYEKCSRPLRRFVRWTLRRAEGVIVLGDCLRPQFEPFLPADRIHVVPNGEDFPELAGAARRYAAARTYRVLYLGNMLPTKGAGDLIEAIPAIVARHPGTRFTFAGAWRTDEFRTWAEEFVRAHALEDVVHFAGPVDRPAKTRLLAEADVFAFPSTAEGHPWVIVEALAAGLPIVSCDVGCIRESVLDGRNGRLVPTRRPDALAAAINAMLDDPDALARMGRESRAHYERGFTRDAFRGRLFDALRAADGVGR